MAAALPAVGSTLSGIAQGYGTKKASEINANASRYGIDVSEAAAKRQLEADKSLTAYTSANQQQLADAYRNAYQTTGNQYETGQKNLASLYDTAAPELGVLEQQALTGQAKELQQGTSQLNANLAQQGVRGGQAATQLARGVGDMTKNASDNIQAIIANEAMQRAGEKRQNAAQTTSAQQQFLLNPQSAQYSQATTPKQQANLEALMKKYLAVGNETTSANTNNKASILSAVTR
jgi:hypothetical protein